MYFTGEYLTVLLENLVMEVLGALKMTSVLNPKTSLYISVVLMKVGSDTLSLLFALTCINSHARFFFIFSWGLNLPIWFIKELIVALRETRKLERSSWERGEPTG